MHQSSASVADVLQRNKPVGIPTDIGLTVGRGWVGYCPITGRRGQKRKTLAEH